VFIVANIGLLTGVQVWSARVVGQGSPRQAGLVLWRGLLIGAIGGLVSVAICWLLGDRLLPMFGVEPSLVTPSARVMNILALSVPLHCCFVAGSGFLEGIGRPGPASVIMWLANGVNLCANALLIPHWGAVGSAWGTVIARGFLLVTLLGWLWRMDHDGALGIRRPPRDGPTTGTLLKVGAAASISHAVESAAFSGMTILAGRLGADTVACYQILLNLLATAFMVALGLASATSVLVSQAVGRRDWVGVGRVGWTGLGLSTAMMTGIGVGFWTFATTIGHAHTSDPVLALLVAVNIGWVAVTLLPDGGQVVLANALRGRGDNWFPTLSHLMSYALVMPPLAYVLAEHRGRGVAGLLEAILLASLLSSATLVGRWLYLAHKFR
jgi:MATE family multidrug resistance protein